jgi:hypothetical protein
MSAEAASAMQLSLLKYLPSGWPPIAEPAILIAFYFFGIIVLKIFMMNRPAFNLEKILKWHNVMLAIMSAAMFALYLWGIIEATLEDGMFGAYCTSRSHNWKIFLAMEVYYLSKIPEFLDTWFLVLKKRYGSEKSPLSSPSIILPFTTTITCLSLHQTTLLHCV